MLDVAILGAGELGGSIAHTLALRDLARTIRLIDDAPNVATGKALDIAQAAPVEGFTTTVTGSLDLSVAASASVIIIADRARGGEWTGDEGTLLLSQISKMGARRFVLCAGAAQRELVERGVRDAGFKPSAIAGSAPEALASGARALLALAANRSVKEIALTLLGIPPAQIVVPWDDVTISGMAATRVLDEPARRNIAAKIAALWPPGPHALSLAATEMVAGLAGRSRRVVSAFVAPAQTDAGRVRTVALPVSVGPHGVTAIDISAIAPNALVALDNARLR
jgi:malate/lactate dehydrogenase